MKRIVNLIFRARIFFPCSALSQADSSHEFTEKKTRFIIFSIVLLENLKIQSEGKKEEQKKNRGKSFHSEHRHRQMWGPWRDLANAKIWNTLSRLSRFSHNIFHFLDEQRRRKAMPVFAPPVVTHGITYLQQEDRRYPSQESGRRMFAAILQI